MAVAVARSMRIPASCSRSMMRLGLELRPAEDGQAHHRDAGLFHEADVLVPGLLRPLVGVVVAAVGEGVDPDLPDALIVAVLGHEGSSLRWLDGMHCPMYSVYTTLGRIRGPVKP